MDRCTGLKITNADCLKINGFDKNLTKLILKGKKAMDY
jgi:hypothetical protein